MAKHAITKDGRSSGSADLSNIPNHLRDKAYELANTEGIPVHGLTILGGKFYVNTTGLDVKVKNMEVDGVILQGTDIDVLERATPESMMAGMKGIVTLFDRVGFLEAIKALGTSGDKDSVESLRIAFTREFKDEGWASPQDVQLPAIKGSAGYLNMMASRRATNRAKRLATGCGLTSLEEINTTELNPEDARKVEVEILQDVEQAPKDLRPADVEETDDERALAVELYNKFIAKPDMTEGKKKVWDVKLKSLPLKEVIASLKKELGDG